MKKVMVAMAVMSMMTTASGSAQDVQPNAQLSKPAREYLEKLVNDKFQNMSPVQIESGEIKMHHQEPGYGTLRNTSSCPEKGGERGAIEEYIKFTTPFKAAPRVVLSLTSIDHVIDSGHTNNLRIRVEVVEKKGKKEIFPDGFRYNFYTWCNTDIYSASASWIAYEER